MNIDPSVFPDPEKDIPLAPSSEIRTIVLAGGCFWCVEAVYRQLDGVVEVRSGYILELIVQRGRVLRLRCHPIEIEEFHQPRLMTLGESANLMDRFWASAERIATRG